MNDNFRLIATKEGVKAKGGKMIQPVVEKIQLMGSENYKLKSVEFLIFSYEYVDRKSSKIKI